VFGHPSGQSATSATTGAPWRPGDAAKHGSRLSLNRRDVRKGRRGAAKRDFMHQWARGGDASAAVNRGVRVLPIVKRFVLLNLFSAGTVELLCGGATLNYDVTLNKPKLVLRQLHGSCRAVRNLRKDRPIAGIEES